MRVFTTADGLANNRVERGAQDAHGFLWFATIEGVSRFDSRRFESFGIEDGLPAAETYDVCATSDGRVWVATEGGLAVLDPASVVRPRFRALTHETTYSLLVDPDGVVWAGTSRGLQRIEHGVVTDVPVPSGVLSIAFDPRDRSLWLGTIEGLVQRTESGEVTSYRFAPRGESDDRVFGVLVARDGTLWVAHVRSRVLALEPPLAPTESLWESPAGLHLEPDGFARRHLLEDAQGTIWIGTATYLYRWRDGKLERLSPEQIGAQGAPGPSLEDSAGNLWFGTDAHGVVRLAPDGLVSYDLSDGLASLRVYDFVQDGDEVYPVALNENGHNIHRRDGDRYVDLSAATGELYRLGLGPQAHDRARTRSAMVVVGGRRRPALSGGRAARRSRDHEGREARRANGHRHPESVRGPTRRRVADDRARDRAVAVGPRDGHVRPVA